MLVYINRQGFMVYRFPERIYLMGLFELHHFQQYNLKQSTSTSVSSRVAMMPTTLRAPLIFAPRNVLDPSQYSESPSGSDCSHEIFPSRFAPPLFSKF